MAFDFKVTVPPMAYIAVRGKGDPNQEGGEYKAAVGVLYALAYTLKMSYKTGHAIDGFFVFRKPLARRVVPEKASGGGCTKKNSLC